MRCLILIAVCFAFASASFTNRNRFNRMLNRYQHARNDRFVDDYSINNRGLNQFEDDDEIALYGSDDVDDYVDDYVDEIRRQKMIERNQCPRDIDQIDDDLFVNDFENHDDEIATKSGSSFYDDDDVEDIENGDRTDNYDDDDRSIRSNQRQLRRSVGVEQAKECEEANAKLTSRLYEQCKEQSDDKNTIASPLSVQLALAALNHGARGNTRKQINRVVAGRLTINERRRVYKTIIRMLKGLKRSSDYGTSHTTKINPVTGIFVTKETRAQQKFVQLVKYNLGATVKHLNFHRQPQQCRQSINRYVSEKTRGKLNHIVPQDAITDNTKMILVNALHMQAPWGRQMSRHVTKEAKFYPLESSKVKIVEVMETEGRFRYHEDELCKIVGIPTKHEELTMYVVVPKDKDGLTEVEKQRLQDGVQLKQMLDTCDKRTKRVDVQLPKFQIKHKIDIRRTLRRQGVTDAFDALRADFSGVNGISKTRQFEIDDHESTMSAIGAGHKLHLNKAIHQATIKITEHGITAATTSGSSTDEDYLTEMDDIENKRSRRSCTSGLCGERENECNTFDEIVAGKYFSGKTTMTTTMTTGARKIVKANHAFAFVIKHNPTNQILLVGRVIDAAQRKTTNDLQSTIDNVDQL